MTEGPFGVRGDVPDHDDRSDTASISSSSSSSSSDSDATYVHEDPEALFAEKVALIERMAEDARIQGQKNDSTIEKERSRALLHATEEKTKRELRMEMHMKKRELKAAGKRAWKDGKKEEYRAWKREAKRSMRSWKHEHKGAYRAWKHELRAQKHAQREVHRMEKREGKKKSWEYKKAAIAADWDKMKGWKERRGSRGSRKDGCMDGIGEGEYSDDVEMKAKEMLWVVVTNHDGL
jgi:hypothetical protein